MDFHKNGVLCTKHRLWKKRTLVVDVIDSMIERGYQFKELVFGEPNNFVFADEYDEIDDLLKRKGGFYGIRIKFERPGVQVEINSNSDGIDNVQYVIFTEYEHTIEQVLTDLEDVKLLMKPSNETVEKLSEYIIKRPKIRNTVIIVLIAITLYFLGIYVFLWDLIRILFSFSPFLMIYIIYLISRRRR